MPQTTIPFLGTLTTRNIPADTQLQAGKDQVFTNCVFEIVQNSATQEANAYVLKRTSFRTGTTVLSTYYIHAAHNSPSSIRNIVAAATTNSSSVVSTIFANPAGAGFVNCGNAAGKVVCFSETDISGVQFIVFTDSTGAGWFLASDAAGDATPTFTGDTHTNTVIDNISSLTNVYVGMLISGTGIQANTRVATITSASAITTTIATTATASITITFERIAKIIDADYPTVVGQFVNMDGYLFVMASGVLNRIYQSDLNSVVSWSPSSYLTANIFNDRKVTLFKHKDRIAAQGRLSTEWHFNNGNPNGSVLSQIKNAAMQVGTAFVETSKNFCNIGDDFYFVGSLGGSLGIYAISNGEISKISSDVVDNIIQSYSGSGSYLVFMSGFMYSGSPMIMLTINLATSPSSNRTQLVCDVNKKFWSKWTGNAATMIVPLYAEVESKLFAYSNVLNTGIQYEFISSNSSSYSDVDAAYSMIIQTEPKSFNNGKPFIVDSIGLLADTQSSGSTTLEVSDDDYASFGTVGTYDLTMQQKTLYGGGYFETAAIFRLTDSGNNAWRGQALVVNWRPA